MSFKPNWKDKFLKFQPWELVLGELGIVGALFGLTQVLDKIIVLIKVIR